MLVKFRKKRLALAMAAAIGGAGLMLNSAHAVNIADDGVGEVLLFQYYKVPSAPGDWQTFFHITNTSDQTIAAKVRFREAENSRDVLNFVIVLSPFDVWTAFTDRNQAGEPVLRTVDTTCTSPMFDRVTTDNPNQNPELKELKLLDRAISGRLADGGGSAPDRLTEGHMEVIALGTAGTDSLVAALAKHGADGTPADYRNIGVSIGCPTVSQAFNSASPDQLNTTAGQFIEPTNALMGNGYLISITEGRAAGFDPVVLANFFNPGPNFGPGLSPVGIGIDGTGPLGVNLIRELNQQQLGAPPHAPLVGAPGDFYGRIGTDVGDVWRNPGPTLNSAFPPVSVVRDDTTGLGPRIILDEWDRGVDAVSAVLSRTTVINEWAAREGTAFSNTSEWVVTFPTKNFYVDLGPDYVDLGPEDTDGNPVNYPTLVGTDADDIALAPFQEDFVAAGASCITATAEIFDREERPAGPSPFPGPVQIPLCNQTNVITFSNSAAPDLNPVLGSRVAVDIAIDELPGEFNVGDVGMMLLGLDSDWLGTDPQADQTYNNGVIEFQVGDAAMEAFCTFFENNGYPPGTGRNNPPPFQPVAEGPGLVGTGNYLGATTVLAGIHAAPFISDLFGGLSTVENGRCNNPGTADNTQENAVIRFEVTGGWAQYDGLPTIGFMATFRTVPGRPDLSFVSIHDHGYESFIDVSPAVQTENGLQRFPLRRAQFDGIAGRWGSAP